MAKRRMREWCHWCRSYQDFEYDPDCLGEQRIICPRCGHDHYRRPDEAGNLVRTGRQSLQQQWFNGSTSYGPHTSTSYVYNAVSGYWYPVT